MKKLNFFVYGGVVVLLVTFAVQVAVINLNAPKSNAFASWIYHPETFETAVGDADLIVLANVIAVEAGNDIVHEAIGHEPEGEVRIPTQRITIEVVESYKGETKTGEQLVLFQTGGKRAEIIAQNEDSNQELNSPVMILEGDPLYKVGEQYLLLLVPGPDNLLRTISPEGRYLVEKDGTLTPMVANEATDVVHGKTVDELESVLLNES
ncbi:MAG: hypothetical protein L0332_25090 [Chloroflexi bacterium]|nr:hypothetical protein [Chloroflexota bacterium]MCI0575166.1 hypothetical protein [Chloroflexota bacterium]MCI0647152.1 hypothetical protein [Chloroflexota bacterium]MCI0729972.1 hypothetical protein [Chloroflexota bacterium]